MAQQPLAEVAEELYALPPQDFTAARSAAAAQARSGGDRDLADAIGALRKPTVVAWLANQLVREHTDEMTALLELGEALRDATAGLDREQLRALAGRQREVVHALVQQARSLGSAAGRPVSEATARGLEETFHAALADAEAAVKLATGQLTDGMSRVGFPGIEPVAPVPKDADTSPRRKAPTAPPAGSAASASKKAAEELAAARRDEQEAKADAATAEKAHREAVAALDAADRADADARQRLVELREQLEQADSVRTGTDHARRAARQVAQRADQAARRAANRLRNATEHRHHLESAG
ncbi:type IV secretory pathway VirB10-like protein [Allocatelliglobosispora scoriae]|uniref:Type IV secretory pathway VirB10-like protein n=1 Tax=Allocatelliglobosispora scoriae TaxID=643052 RepID=A0A841BKU1_9ACTN|nr:hypothetical protein [Allocatelliglobosispora scoriae]MBB5867856.1 type IV secretory pathway VirB10-like protein [Allocatelliglobosispora scoriae]